MGTFTVGCKRAGRPARAYFDAETMDLRWTAGEINWRDNGLFMARLKLREDMTGAMGRFRGV